MASQYGTAFGTSCIIGAHFINSNTGKAFPGIVYLSQLSCYTQSDFFSQALSKMKLAESIVCHTRSREDGFPCVAASVTDSELILFDLLALVT